MFGDRDDFLGIVAERNADQDVTFLHCAGYFLSKPTCRTHEDDAALEHRHQVMGQLGNRLRAQLASDVDRFCCRAKVRRLLERFLGHRFEQTLQ